MNCSCRRSRWGLHDVFVHDMIRHLRDRGMDTIANSPHSPYANALSHAVFHANVFHRVFSNAVYMTAVAQASIMS